jgi:hypothetical protein
MNDRPLHEARNPDLPRSLVALRRAARRAREIAVQTDTELVVVRNGVIQYIRPEVTGGAPSLREPPADYESGQ